MLAGGAGTRFPGKLGAEVDGEALLVRAVAALAAVLPEVVVVAKKGVALPAVRVAVWTEPAEPRHPLFGVAWALGRAGGRDVLVAAGDMPSITAQILGALAEDAGSAAAVVPRHAGGIEPLLARYRPAAAAGLRAGAMAGRPAREIAEGLAPDWLDVPDAAAFRNVNRPEDLSRT